MKMKRPSMADVARAAGVSKNAVSLALRHDPQISLATRERIEEAARALGYQYHPVVGELMARLRQSQHGGAKATLALINANTDAEALQRHPTVPTYVEGCQRRARALGYGLDHFWLHHEKLRGKSLLRILRTRGIRGVLLVGLMKTNRLPEHILPVLEAFPCVVTGVRTRKPALSFACVDHHMLSLRAFEQAIAMGYRRPGLVLDQTIDDLVDGRFSAGYMIGQQALPAPRRLSPFYRVSEAREDPGLFRAWLERERPDMIFTLYNVVRDWVGALGLRVPEDVGLAQLEWRRNRPEWAGMDQHNDLCGEAAVDMLVGMIHRGEGGIPNFPRATLMGSTWIEGQTLPERSEGGRVAATAGSAP
jgi:LacI family transcriptional regulator